QMPHEVLGGDPRPRLATGLELAPSVVGQREGERLAEVVRIGAMEWLVGHAERIASRIEQDKNTSCLATPNRTSPFLAQLPPEISTIRRTGRLLVASMPLSSSVRPALPPQPGDDVADRYGTLSLWRVHLVEHPVLAAAVAGNPHEPRRERHQRLVEGFARSGSSP
ncbi:MAG TPA: hypothetical protein VK955_02855, partial [Xanthobacteraceae bacterium]|nr:hypothetical protein [Xanthobacteraceae bacterium]